MKITTKLSKGERVFFLCNGSVREDIVSSINVFSGPGGDKITYRVEGVSTINGICESKAFKTKANLISSL